MYQLYQDRLRLLDNSHGTGLLQGLIGIEREALRMDAEGRISQSPHPRALGAALTHPHITTDYSEALLELITPPLGGTEQALSYLRQLHAFVYRQLDGERLWTSSMPCLLAGEESIPIARYGDSNNGRMKHIYRVGLAYRYGRAMQVIAGLHFNYSFPDALWEVLLPAAPTGGDRSQAVSSAYFGLIRNLRRFNWLIPYLFGCSPAVCKSFFGDRAVGLAEFGAGTYYLPYGTSLRMSDVGYKNRATINWQVSYNSLSEYVAGLRTAIETPHPDYDAIGVKVDGRYRQLNSNILQIENEYYGTVRPKQLLEGQEKPSLALQRRGVRYIELRSLDVNSFAPLGLDADTSRFLQILVCFCLLSESPPISPAEEARIVSNEVMTAREGRTPGLTLVRAGRSMALRRWALELFDAMEDLCGLLDLQDPNQPFRRSLRLQRDKVLDPAITPSARMLDEMRRHGEGFFEFAMRKSDEHGAAFQTVALSLEQTRELERMSEESRAKQQRLEADRSQSFEDFLAAYFSQGSSEE